MDAIDFCEVLNGALDMAGIDPARLQTLQFNQLRRAANFHIREAVKKQFWPELVLTEQRWFSAKYAAGTAYTNDGTFVYWPLTKTYFHAVRGTTGNAPTDVNGVQDFSRWAAASVDLSGLQVWKSTATYVAGDQFYDPTTDANYQCWLAAPAGTLPTNAAYFGLLYAWDRYVPYTQTVNIIRQPLWVGDQNPRARQDAREVKWEESNNGIQVMDSVPYVWIKYRTGIAQLVGGAWDAGATYVAGRQVYFEDQPAVPGNFFTVVTGQTAGVGQSPEANPAKWSVVQIPVRFGNYLTQAMYAEWLKADGQIDKFGGELAIAVALLEEEAYELAATEQQRLPMECQTR